MNNMRNFELFKTLTETPGVSGREYRIRNIIKDKVSSLVDECYTDNIGNLICFKKGDDSNTSVVVSAHMDEIGFIVSYIDDNGFIRVTNLGGFDPKTLTSQRVIIQGEDEDILGVISSKPIHVMETEERKRSPKISDLFIDTGLPVEKVKEKVKKGNPITRYRDAVELGNYWSCKSIDNRASVYSLINSIHDLQYTKLYCDTYFVFTVQEEVGARGINVASQSINPDFGINMDTTIAYDLPGASPQEVMNTIDGGTSIQVLDNSAISDYRMFEYLKEIAENEKLPYQIEADIGGGTDLGGLQRSSQYGAIACGISIPIRNMHQEVEMVSPKILHSTSVFLNIALSNLNKNKLL